MVYKQVLFYVKIKLKDNRFINRDKASDVALLNYINVYKRRHLFS